MTTDRPVLLTGYDAKRCARRIHNEWDPAIEKVVWETPADLQMRFQAGIDFEATVFAELEQASTKRSMRTCPRFAGRTRPSSQPSNQWIVMSS